MPRNEMNSDQGVSVCEMCENGEQCIHCLGAERDRYRAALRWLAERPYMDGTTANQKARAALDERQVPYPAAPPSTRLSTEANDG